MHALRVELLVRHVMSDIVPPDEDFPFQYWLRFEWGPGGNPHAHGKCHVDGNPTFEHVVTDEETRLALIAQHHAEALKLRTKTEAECELGNLFDAYLKEWHPCKDDTGANLFPYIQNLLRQPDLAQKDGKSR